MSGHSYRWCATTTHASLPLDAQAGAACPECGVYFVDKSAVRKHMAQMHPDVSAVEPIDPETINREDISINGMPICKSCSLNFCSWQKLLKHVYFRRCPGLSYDTAAGVIPRTRACPASVSVSHTPPAADPNNVAPVSSADDGALPALGSSSCFSFHASTTADAPLPLLKRKELISGMDSRRFPTAYQ